MASVPEPSSQATAAPVRVLPGGEDPAAFFYPAAYHASMHPTVAQFLSLAPAAIVDLYCSRNTTADPLVLAGLLRYQPKALRWGGADLLRVTDAAGQSGFVLIEMNSCPAGQKSLPPINPAERMRGYRQLIRETLLPWLSCPDLPAGALAVLYDKNPIEAAGYAWTLADLTEEPVWLVPCSACQPHGMVFVDGVLQLSDATGNWHPIRAALRYVTQRPWTRFPLTSRTALLNPLVACLAGGRNKLVAAKAYATLNTQLLGSGLAIRTPQTITDLRREQVPHAVESFGGQAVVKAPYNNAGQGIYIITSSEELAAFMQQPCDYELWLVQQLIGGSAWSTAGVADRLTHQPLAHNATGQPYVADLRMLLSSTPHGLRPLGLYCRTAAAPLSLTQPLPFRAQAMLTTNLSVKYSDGSWGTEAGRLLLMDTETFPKLGLSLYDLVDVFVQSALALIAVDQQAARLTLSDGTFNLAAFAALNPDSALLRELALGGQQGVLA